MRRTISTREDLLVRIRQLAVPVLAPYARRIFLFGSVARNEHDSDSDIDLFVELKDPGSRPKLDLLDLVELEQRLGQLLGRDVDLITALRPRVRERVAKDMVLLYEGGHDEARCRGQASRGDWGGSHATLRRGQSKSPRDTVARHRRHAS